MFMYAWMLIVETAPERYDWGMKVMTMGRINRIKDIIAASVRPRERILDLGCGTGTLALRCMARGATVTGVDSSEFMLQCARKNAAAQGMSNSLELVKDSVTQISKHFSEHSFDTIMSTAALGEFPKSYLEFIFAECHRLIKPGGRLILADELQPENPILRLLYGLLMVLLWIPQFLIVRRIVYPIKDLSSILARTGFRVEQRRGFPPSNLSLVVATKQ